MVGLALRRMSGVADFRTIVSRFLYEGLYQKSWNYASRGTLEV
jgi:hypothetical protein